ncbi:hypothetical protein TeGR_g12796 [Tetraparma gracilis]|uniref:Uncharacterized protein n=1 Tax=Tetraparma gracilis TaxID=2962635 RepID=A0ABQ6MZQ9_9STRA|nr:hypothetical protein TeGR_g12796 [Tetraparma gracilis]
MDTSSSPASLTPAKPELSFLPGEVVLVKTGRGLKSQETARFLNYNDDGSETAAVKWDSRADSQNVPVSTIMKVGGGGKRERKTTPRFDRSAHSSPSQSKAKAGKKEKEGGGGGRRGKSKAVAKATPVKIEGAGKSPAVGKKRTPGGTTKRTVVGVDDWKSRRMPNIGPRADLDGPIPPPLSQQSDSSPDKKGAGRDRRVSYAEHDWSDVDSKASETTRVYRTPANQRTKPQSPGGCLSSSSEEEGVAEYDE